MITSEHERAFQAELAEFERTLEITANGLGGASPWIDRLRARVRELRQLRSRDANEVDIPSP